MVRKLYYYFSVMLNYPSENFFIVLKNFINCINRMNYPEINQFKPFLEEAKNISLTKLEEVYTCTFDLQPVCFPYVSYQIFGESYERTSIMLYLKELYKNYNFNENQELPDHLRVIFKFLSIIEEEKIEKELIEDLLVPSLNKMIQGFKNKSNPYYSLLLMMLQILNYRKAYLNSGGKNG